MAEFNMETFLEGLSGVTGGMRTAEMTNIELDKLKKRQAREDALVQLKMEDLNRKKLADYLDQLQTQKESIVDAIQKTHEISPSEIPRIFERDFYDWGEVELKKKPTELEIFEAKEKFETGQIQEREQFKTEEELRKARTLKTEGITTTGTPSKPLAEQYSYEQYLKAMDSIGAPDSLKNYKAFREWEAELSLPSQVKAYRDWVAKKKSENPNLADDDPNLSWEAYWMEKKMAEKKGAYKGMMDLSGMSDEELQPYMEFAK